MAKRREPMWGCGVYSCNRRRVQGTAYCAKHAKLPSRAPSRRPRPTWIWILVTGVPATWCLSYANELLGAACEHVTFHWSGLITSAFTCGRDGASGSSSLAWLSAPEGTVVGAVLAVSGFALAVASIGTAIVLHARSREA
jgi:hypothetical protein